MIRDFERQAVLEAEGGNLWAEWKSGNPGIELYSPQLNQFTHLAGVTGKIWIRNDRAIARADAVGTMITFDLPQALKYEVELTAANQQKARQDAGQIIGEQARHPLATPQNARSPIQSPVRPEVVPKPPSQTQAGPVFTPISSFAPMFAGLLVVATLSGVVAKMKKKPKRFVRRPEPQKPTRTVFGAATPSPIPSPAESFAPPKPRSLKDLTWDEFELLVGHIYQRRGYQVTLSAGTGSDGGVDLRLSKGDEKVFVQCKCWNSSDVGVKDIREFFGVLISEKADRGIFVTTGAFTRDALAFSAGKPIEMIDEAKLGHLIRESSLGSNDDLLNVRLWAPVFLSSATVTTPDCPFCKKTMIKRTSGAGSFWGCRSYPGCRGKRQIRQYFEECCVV